MLFENNLNAWSVHNVKISFAHYQIFRISSLQARSEDEKYLFKVVNLQTRV